ncbi:hypothetical protein EDEG_00263 [Edhazardia aedis USNM 41457]|uniref:Uncharacterized protein n=1 Tax=Edhazardia aedis (strain USNM 41457) TaxID=1003232 RepID=J9D506_EDHAE|nr:hypothetical protein EDEG_00263 [Edhazardia aedis USNM 41457]|eukprot:EJW02609.1 hypothetical protein EDEG_00263 [Edhazardia aedis USNM 41457]
MIFEVLEIVRYQTPYENSTQTTYTFDIFLYHVHSDSLYKFTVDPSQHDRIVKGMIFKNECVRIVERKGCVIKFEPVKEQDVIYDEKNERFERIEVAGDFKKETVKTQNSKKNKKKNKKSHDVLSRAERNKISGNNRSKNYTTNGNTKPNSRKPVLPFFIGHKSNSDMALEPYKITNKRLKKDNYIKNMKTYNDFRLILHLLPFSYKYLPFLSDTPIISSNSKIYKTCLQTFKDNIFPVLTTVDELKGSYANFFSKDLVKKKMYAYLSNSNIDNDRNECAQGCKDAITSYISVNISDSSALQKKNDLYVCNDINNQLSSPKISRNNINNIHEKNTNITNKLTKNLKNEYLIGKITHKSRVFVYDRVSDVPVYFFVILSSGFKNAAVFFWEQNVHKYYMQIQRGDIVIFNRYRVVYKPLGSFVHINTYAENFLFNCVEVHLNENSELFKITNDCMSNKFINSTNSCDIKNPENIDANSSGIGNISTYEIDIHTDNSNKEQTHAAINYKTHEISTKTVNIMDTKYHSDFYESITGKIICLSVLIRKRNKLSDFLYEKDRVLEYYNIKLVDEFNRIRFVQLFNNSSLIFQEINTDIWIKLDNLWKLTRGNFAFFVSSCFTEIHILNKDQILENEMLLNANLINTLRNKNHQITTHTGQTSIFDSENYLPSVANDIEMLNRKFKYCNSIDKSNVNSITEHQHHSINLESKIDYINESQAFPSSANSNHSQCFYQNAEHVETARYIPVNQKCKAYFAELHKKTLSMSQSVYIDDEISRPHSFNKFNENINKTALLNEKDHNPESTKTIRSLSISANNDDYDKCSSNTIKSFNEIEDSYNHKKVNFIIGSVDVSEIFVGGKQKVPENKYIGIEDEEKHDNIKNNLNNDQSNNLETALKNDFISHNTKITIQNHDQENLFIDKNLKNSNQNILKEYVQMGLENENKKMLRNIICFLPDPFECLYELNVDYQKNLITLYLNGCYTDITKINKTFTDINQDITVLNEDKIVEISNIHSEKDINSNLDILIPDITSKYDFYNKFDFNNFENQKNYDRIFKIRRGAKLIDIKLSKYQKTFATNTQSILKLKDNLLINEHKKFIFPAKLLSYDLLPLNIKKKSKTHNFGEEILFEYFLNDQANVCSTGSVVVQCEGISLNLIVQYNHFNYTKFEENLVHRICGLNNNFFDDVCIDKYFFFLVDAFRIDENETFLLLSRMF